MLFAIAEQNLSLFSAHRIKTFFNSLYVGLVPLTAMPVTTTSRTQAVNRPRAVELNLVDPPDKITPETDTGIDIIAIHGLDTKSPETWAYKTSDGQQVNWLVDGNMLSREVPGTRIYTCNWPAAMFETNDSVPFGIEELATSLLHGLLGLISNRDRKLFFIASCLGGVILMQTLVMAKGDYAAIQEATRGIIFLATPFRGTSFEDIAVWAQPGLSALASIRNQRLTELLDWVKAPESKLVHLVCEFSRLCVKHRDEDFKVATFYEKRYTLLTAKVPSLSRLLPYEKKLLVNMDSATLDCVPIRLPLDRPHVLMNKFCAEEADYRQVVETIRGFLDVIRTGTLLEQADAWIRERCYTEERLKVERLSGDPVDKHQSYINLAIVKQPERGISGRDRLDEKGSLSPFTLLARQKLEVAASDDEINLTKIFDQRENSDDTHVLPRRILIRGRAGIGKTTLCKKMIHEFMRNGMWNSLFDRALWIPLRNLKQRPSAGYNLSKLFDHEFFHSSNEYGIGGIKLFSRELHKALKHNRTLFILDGWDEVVNLTGSGDMSVFLLDLLKQPNVIIMSRPSASLPHGVKVDLELETIGFKPKQIDDYIEKVHRKNVHELKGFLQSHELVRGLVRIPIQLDAFCYCWNDIKFDGTEKPDTMTTLYQAIQTSLWKKDAERLTKVEAQSLRTAGQRQIENEVKQQLQFLEYLGFSGLATNRIEFNEIDRNIANEHSELLLNLDDSLPCLSFLRTSDLLARPNYQLYYFIHLTFQEYFAARYFVRHWKEQIVMKYTVFGKKKISTTRPLKFLQSHKYDGRYNIMWRFVAGLLHEQGRGFELLQAIEEEPLDLIGPSHQRLIMHCLSEIPCSETEPPSYRARLEKTLSDWLLFECDLKESTSLAIEAEFPDSSLKIALQQGQTKAKCIILRSIRKRALSQELLGIIMSFIEQDYSELTDSAIAALKQVSTLRERHVHILLGLLRNEDYYHRLIMEILMNQFILSDEHNDALVETFQKRMILIRPQGHDGQRRRGFYRLSTVRRPFATAFVKWLMSTEHEDYWIIDPYFYGALPEVVLEVIAEHLDDQDPNKQMAALKAFRYHHDQLPAATIEAITKQIEEDRQSGIQMAALETLERHRGQLPAATIKSISKMLEKETDPDLRKAALEPLGNQSSLPPTIMSVISKQPQDPNYDIQDAAFKLLVTQPALCQSAIDVIIKHLKRLEPDAQEAILKTLRYESIPCTEVIMAITEHLDDSQPNIQAAVLKVLEHQSNLPSATIEAFTAQLEIPEPRVQKASLEALKHQSNLPQATIEAIKARLEIPEPEVQKAALEALKHQSNLPQAMIEAIKARLKDPDREVQKAALEALPKQSELPQATVDAIVELLSENDSRVRTTALSTLQNQKALPKATVDKITRYLHDPHGGVRLKAVEALGAHSPLPKSVLDTISDLLKNDYVGWEAEDVLKQPVLPKILIDAITRRIEDTAESSRQAITSVLEGKSDLPQMTVQILNQRLKDASTDFSEASVIALVSQKTLPESVINSIVREVNDLDPRIRRGILEAIKVKLYLPQGIIEAVIMQLRATESAVRNAALDVLKVQYELLPAAAEAITELLRNPDTEIQKAALEAFKHRSRSTLPPETIETVIELLENPDKGICASASAVLANQLVLSQEAVAAIINLLEKTEGYNEGLYKVLKRQPAFVKVAAGMFADLTYTDKGTATGLGAPAHPKDQTLKWVCNILVQKGFEESLSLHIRDNTVRADDRNGQKSFDLGANVDRFRSSIATSRLDGYPL
ncbi:peptidase C14 [Fusarium globosum]|uniref:Peptidase C14 n=1 Tax=Fusarium globosum TaxID=78864 RepID=A0A8H5XM98_9HYPO|nr:peptidase C14 [Fusarium globosum]